MDLHPNPTARGQMGMAERRSRAATQASGSGRDRVARTNALRTSSSWPSRALVLAKLKDADGVRRETCSARRAILPLRLDGVVRRPALAECYVSSGPTAKLG